MQGKYGTWVCGCGVEWPLTEVTDQINCAGCGGSVVVSVQTFDDKSGEWTPDPERRYRYVPFDILWDRR